MPHATRLLFALLLSLALLATLGDLVFSPRARAWSRSAAGYSLRNQRGIDALLGRLIEFKSGAGSTNR